MLIRCACAAGPLCEAESLIIDVGLSRLEYERPAPSGPADAPVETRRIMLERRLVSISKQKHTWAVVYSRRPFMDDEALAEMSMLSEVVHEDALRRAGVPIPMDGSAS